MLFLARHLNNKHNVQSIFSNGVKVLPPECKEYLFKLGFFFIPTQVMQPNYVNMQHS